MRILTTECLFLFMFLRVLKRLVRVFYEHMCAGLSMNLCYAVHDIDYNLSRAGEYVCIDASLC